MHIESEYHIAVRRYKHHPMCLRAIIWKNSPDIKHHKIGELVEPCPVPWMGILMPCLYAVSEIFVEVSSDVLGPDDTGSGITVQYSTVDLACV